MKYTILALLLTAFPAHASVLSDVLDTLSEGEAASIPGIDCTKYAIYSTVGGGAVSFTFASAGAWNPVMETAEYIGSGHGTGNKWSWWKYDVAANRCTHQDPGINKPTHVYQHLGISQSGERRYTKYMGNTRQSGLPWVHKYDGSNWQVMNNGKTPTWGVQITSAIVHNSALQLWFVANSKRQLVMRDNNTTAIINQKLVGYTNQFPYAIWAVSSEGQQRVYWGGGVHNFGWRAFDGATSVSMPNLPWVCDSGNCAAIGDEANNRILFFRNNGSVWQFRFTSPTTGQFSNTGLSHPFAQGGPFALIDLEPSYPAVLAVYKIGGGLIGFGAWRKSGTGTPAQPVPPTSGFSLTSTGATCTATFSDSSLDASSYHYDFGDGATSQQASPTHIYSVGSYNVVQTVSNQYGADSTSQVVDCQ